MVRLQTEPIEVEELVRAAGSPADGAVALFLGSVRDRNSGRRVLHLEYQAYAPMAESEMARIEREAIARFGVSRVAVVHRTGRLEIGEASVGIAVSAPRRDACYQASRDAIEILKRDVPIWKKEFFEGGAVWIEGPTGAP